MQAGAHELNKQTQSSRRAIQLEESKSAILTQTIINGAVDRHGRACTVQRTQIIGEAALRGVDDVRGDMTEDRRSPIERLCSAAQPPRAHIPHLAVDQHFQPCGGKGDII